LTLSPDRLPLGRVSHDRFRHGPVSDLDDPDLLQPPLDRSFKKPGGYVMRDKLAAARQQSGTTKPRGNAG